MKQYADLLKYVLNNGEESTDRTGVGTIKTFGNQLRFNLKEGFPLVTGKKIHIKSMVHELLWFISGNTNIKYLQENGVRIWNEWADKNGDLGPVYGKQWRNVTPDNSHRLAELLSQMDKWNFEKCFKEYHLNRKEAYKSVEHSMSTSRQMVSGIINQKTIDQLKNAIDTIKKNPDSRRIIVNSWNVSEIDKMALPPCHMFYQFQVSKKGLSCLIYQRSVDTFLGLPLNIASYALLTHMVAQVCDLEVNELIWTGGDIHIYSNHVDQVKEYLSKEQFKLPALKLNQRIKDIDDFKFEDIEIVGYESGPVIKAEVAV